MATTSPGTTWHTFSLSALHSPWKQAHFSLSEHLSKEDERLGCIIVVHIGEVSKGAQYNSMR